MEVTVLLLVLLALAAAGGVAAWFLGRASEPAPSGWSLRSGCGAEGTGPRFDLRAFHDASRGHGQLPLDLLEKSIKDWAENSYYPR